MSNLVVDNYVDLQAPGTEKVSPSEGTWTPSSFRITTGTNPTAEIKSSPPVQLVITTSGTNGNLGFLEYDYQATHPININGYIITLNNGKESNFGNTFYMQVTSEAGTSPEVPGTISGSASDFVVSWGPIESDVFTDVDLSNVLSIDFLVNTNGLADTITFGNGETDGGLSTSLACVLSNTLILLGNNEKREIKDVQRGDEINCDGEIKRVCVINKQLLNGDAIVNMVKFEMGSLGENKPYRSLYVTKNHPIIYEGSRRPAYCFQNLDGVTFYKNIKMSDLLGVMEDYNLYDLQFEDDSSYMANGILVQSRSPYSDLTPLSKKLYFDESKYKNERTWDSLNHKLPLCRDVLLVN